MATDMSKLTTLAQFKSGLQAAKNYTDAQDLILSGRIDEVVQTIDGIVSVGGEANVLNGVKVNGTALPIANKMVDILIAAGSENGTISVNNVDVAIKGLQALAFKAQVSESDLDAALTAVLAAKATQSDLDTLGVRVTDVEGDLATLIGEDAGKSVRAISAEEVAKIVADAPEAYNTLKELADWLASHETDAAGMNSAIQTNAADIEALETLVGTLPEGVTSTTVVGYIAEAIAAIGIGDYAKTSEVTAAINAALENYYTKSEVDAKVKAVDDKFADYSTTAQVTEQINAVDAKFANYSTSAQVTEQINAVDAKFANYSTTTQMNAVLDGYATEAEAATAASTAVTNATASDAEVEAMLEEVFGG